MSTSADERTPVQVDVYIANVSLLAPPGAEAAFTSRLTAEECARIERMKSPERRRQYTVSRVLVRAALAEWSGTPAGAWQIVAEENRRPFAHPPMPGATVPSLNWSHSGAHVVCALCAAGEVGVDIECIEARDIDTLAGEVMAREEREFLVRQPEPSRLETFYRFWTLKEAYVKAIGTGLATPLRQLQFDLSSHAGGIRFLSGLGTAAERPTVFASFSPAVHTVAALAVLLPSPRRLALRFRLMQAVDRFADVESVGSTVL